ncbi:ankyrin repeat domain-containing protein [Pseudonocardia sp. CA-142604]|uniref:ankyrin repeat domain-containing protein n=1 Tax=Pseudonocardia sp. CA-142604 TaxID=3240024 RepID=UPI003D8CBF62
MPATLSPDHPLAVAAVDAIRIGALDTLTKLLAENPGLATARLGDDREARSLLHVLTDWPGHFPGGAATVAALVDAGADVNARFVGPHAETPLHWAASCDDVEVLDALLDAGADINADGAVIAGGTPLTDATAFGQWSAARRLIERGAHSGLWESATLGLLDRVEACFSADPAPTMEEITGAFWGACHGGHRSTAEYLLSRGADLNWVGWNELTPLDAAVRHGATDLADWLRALGGRSSPRR